MQNSLYFLLKKMKTLFLSRSEVIMIGISENVDELTCLKTDVFD